MNEMNKFTQEEMQISRKYVKWISFQELPCGRLTLYCGKAATPTMNPTVLPQVVSWPINPFFRNLMLEMKSLCFPGSWNEDTHNLPVDSDIEKAGL